MGSKELFSEILLILLTILTILLLYPVLIIIVLISTTYRSCITLIVNRNPKVGIGNVMSGLDACFAGKDPYRKPIAVIVPFYVFNSKVNIKKVMQVFTDKILTPENNGGKCIYPEMTQKIIKKFGYYFWHNNGKFDVSDHIKYLNDSDPEAPITRLEMHDCIAQKLVKSPFDPERSPWEIYVIPNFIDPGDPAAKSSILFRFNHCLFDGYSVINFMRRIAVKPWKDLGGETKPMQLKLWERIVQVFLLVFTGPYHFLKFVLFTNDEHEWMDTATRNFKNQITYHETKPIRIETFKNIRSYFKVSLTSVLFTLVVEGVRLAMEKRNIKPRKVHICTPFPLANHPTTPTNHWTPAKIPIMFIKDDPIKTLQSINTEYHKLHRSLLPLMTWNFSKFVGLLPIPLHPNSEMVVKSTFLISNFPGPSHHVDMFGYEMSEFGYGGNTVPGFSIYVAILSYNGKFRLSIGGDASILPEKKDAVSIIKDVEDVLSKWEFAMEKLKC